MATISITTPYQMTGDVLNSFAQNLEKSEPIDSKNYQSPRYIELKSNDVPNISDLLKYV